MEEGTPFFEIIGGDGERERFCRGSGRYDLGKRSARRDGGMRRLEITIGQVEDQAASVFERATSRATYRKPVGMRPRRCLQSEVKIRFQAFSPPGPGCAEAAISHRGRMHGGREKGRRARGAQQAIQPHLMELAVQAKLRRRILEVSLQGSLGRASPTRDYEVGKIELILFQCVAGRGS